MTYLVLGVVAGLAAVERKGFLQAMLARPVVLGTLAGLALGDPVAGLFVGVPLELLWLGAVNLGASLPVHEALGTAVITGATVIAARALAAAGFTGPAVLPAIAVLSVALGAPMALVGRSAERMAERWNDRLLERAHEALATGSSAGMAQVNLLGLALPFGVGLVLAPAGAAIAGSIVSALLLRAPAALGPLGMGWAVFAGFACASGARALRDLRAPVYFHAALAAGALLAGSAALAGGGG